ncbi:MAG: hypothetical protein NC427_03945 [Ruminococcus flavefaciens]|nr:hypothetical protein [Ruminococcus flavefaciens]
MTIEFPHVSRFIVRGKALKKSGNGVIVLSESKQNPEERESGAEMREKWTE